VWKVAFFRKCRLIIPLILALGYFGVVAPGHGCVAIPPVKVGLKTLTEEPMEYEGKRIETSGKVVAYPTRQSFKTWHFWIEKDGERLRCFERTYRVEHAPCAPVIRRAKREGEEITVMGKLCHDGIELQWIEYKGMRFNTDLLLPHPPPRILSIPSFLGSS
jgi:hypothetical protein